MPRATNNVASRRRRKKVLDRAKGNFGGRSKLIRTAKETVQKGLTYAYRDRRNRKRDYRRLWITRISAACRAADITYSKFINGLLKAGVNLDRKVLADMAIRDKATFVKLAEIAKSA
ncbi:MAG: 50S ribosomal protein L20 [candidate division Zixibacteria bacterium]|nr:50S ribosomal protein L20 [candidate division Zixibacteria bacterium]